MTKSDSTNGSADVEDPVASEIGSGIVLTRIVKQQLNVDIVSCSPLIVHRFGEKARKQMLDAQQGRKTRIKEPKDPARDFEESKYLLPDGRDGFPAVGFKAAIVGAARLFDGISMAQLKSMIHVLGEGPDQLVPIVYDECIMRQDNVRVGGGTADLRFRPQYTTWGATLIIQHVPSVISSESIVALVDAAGIGGIGEWRPSKSATGSYGTFEVVT